MTRGEAQTSGTGRASAVAARPPEAYQFKDVLYDKKDWIARITINRPRSYNSYTTATLQEMTLAFQDASWDDGVAVVVLTGAGEKAFCTGGDVKEYAEVYTRRPRDYWKYMGVFAAAIDSVRGCGKPVVARLNGIVAGGGNEFNLACDLAVAGDHVTFRQVGTRVGSVAAGGATQWLPVTIGDRRAREMLFTCDEITARQALEWGLINRVVSAADLDKAVDELAQKIIDKFPECTRYTKQQVNFWKDLSWYSTVGHARDWLSLHFMSPEPYEGMTAFVEKRSPRYRELRQRAADGRSSEFLWGPYTRMCSACGAQGIPEEFDFCGKCGAKLA